MELKNAATAAFGKTRSGQSQDEMAEWGGFLRHATGVQAGKIADPNGTK